MHWNNTDLFGHLVCLLYIKDRPSNPSLAAGPSRLDPERAKIAGPGRIPSCTKSNERDKADISSECG